MGDYSKNNHVRLHHRRNANLGRGITDLIKLIYYEKFQ